jgi:hypothetical protein
MVLLVFAGSAAEFALNRAVDWLFFTGKVPSDPIGRLFGSRRERSTLARASPATLKILAFLGADPSKCNSDGIYHGGHRAVVLKIKRAWTPPAATGFLFSGWRS